MGFLASCALPVHVCRPSQIGIAAEMWNLSLDMYWRSLAAWGSDVEYQVTIATPKPTADTAKFCIVVSDGHHEPARPIQVLVDPCQCWEATYEVT